MDTMYLPAAESYNGLRTIVYKLQFHYSWMDIQAAAKAKVGKILSKLKILKYYPDTTALKISHILTMSNA
jgi:hypothetical protein